MKIRFISIFMVLLFSIYIVESIKYLLYIPNQLDYFDAELLINYSSGFIRRGLLGEIFIFIHQFLKIDLLVLTKYFSIITYGPIIIYFVYNFIKKNISLFFLLLPSGLFFLLIDNRIRFRDSLLLLIIIVCAKIIKWKKINEITRYLLLSLIISLGILFHEMFFFYTVPFIFLYFLMIKKRNISFILIFSLPLLCFLLSIYYHGEKNSGDIIYHHIIPLLDNHQISKELPSPFKFINSGIQNYFKFTFLSIHQGFSLGILYFQYIVSLIFILVRYYDFNNIDIFGNTNKHLKPINFQFLLFVFLIQIISSIAILGIAKDWQRFIFFALISSFIYTNELSTKVDFIEIFHFKFDNFIAKYIVGKNRALTIFVSTILLVPHLKLGNINYFFSNGYFMIFNYFTKILYIITS